MDPLEAGDKGVGMSIWDRLAEGETADSGNGNLNARHSFSTVVNFTEDTGTARSTSTVGWAKELEQRPDSTEPVIRRRSEATVIARECDDAGFGRPQLTNSSNISLPAPEKSSKHQDESISITSTDFRRLRLKKVKSKVLGQDEADTGHPTPRPRIRLRKQFSTIFSPKSFSKSTIENHSGEAVTTQPQIPAAMNLRWVRNIEMEAKCRELGIPIPRNRFGLEEVMSDSSAVEGLTNIKIAGVNTPVKYSDESITASPEVDIHPSQTAYHQTPMEHEEVRSPPAETASFCTSTESDPLAWLKNSFQSQDPDLLKNFGTPPKDSSSAAVKDRPAPHSTPSRSRSSQSGSHLGISVAVSVMGDLDAHEDVPSQPSSRGAYRNLHDETQILQSRVEELLKEACVVNEARQCELTRLSGLETEIERLRQREQQLIEELEFHMTREVEIYNARAGEAVALEMLQIAEMKLKFHENDFEGHEDSFEFTTTTHEAPQKPNTTSFQSTKEGQKSNQPVEKRSSRKKLKSPEGGFFNRIFGAKEPSRDALNELRKKTFAEANVNKDDPDAAAKLKVSTKKLPAEAPKPASKDPVPKLQGEMSKLRRFASFDNLTGGQGKDSGSLSLKKDYNANASRTSQVVNSNSQSLTSITEVFSKGSKSPGHGTQPSSFTNEGDSQWSEDASIPRADPSQVVYGGHLESSRKALIEHPTAAPRATGERPAAAYDYDRPSLARIYQEVAMDMVDRTGYMTIEARPPHSSRPARGPNVIQHRRTPEIFSQGDLFKNRSEQSRNPVILQGWGYAGLSHPDHTASSREQGYQAQKHNVSPKKGESSTVNDYRSEYHYMDEEEEEEI